MDERILIRLFVPFLVQLFSDLSLWHSILPPSSVSRQISISWNVIECVDSDISYYNMLYYIFQCNSLQPLQTSIQDLADRHLFSRPLKDCALSFLGLAPGFPSHKLRALMRFPNHLEVPKAKAMDIAKLCHDQTWLIREQAIGSCFFIFLACSCIRRYLRECKIVVWQQVSYTFYIIL